ncbi:putative toxin-antitoxin system toxin component, PIN family [Synechocystis sp. CACIAM 05]|uniref:putative toxin-antitoxin system toxin component, PIN family n=1 Tax=Synechocystis sp. CACIAM 05 TaxID=1933929 RepID=UPI00138E64BD|nr:putative toxin-antitoxin system toxin component, PIN family [Synechocystis sp. CACIAM 05]QHU99316.1 putative toxin-antitoxin system toxin component, PIN family [Synechocystis sp. CACIAM 05]
MKVVLDTNLWLSGWLWQGLPGNLIKLARKKEILTCTSVEILQEVEKVLSYQKLQKRLALLSLTTEEILLAMGEISTIYPIHPLEVRELRDPKDAMVLATAIAAQADVIISGDSDLLILETYQNIPIFTAKQFLDSL